MRHGAAASNHRPRTMGGGQKILTQNEANCSELSRIPANSRQLLTEELAFFDQLPVQTQRRTQLLGI